MGCLPVDAGWTSLRIAKLEAFGSGTFAYSFVFVSGNMVRTFINMYSKLENPSKYLAEEKILEYHTLRSENHFSSFAANN